MRFVIVTGMSGAGKSSALKRLEDLGYFCVDNLPIQLAEKFASLTTYGKDGIDKVALGLDIRSGHYLKDLNAVLMKLKRQGFEYEILFMDCSSQVLIKRYKDTRRNHPLATGTDTIQDGIDEERNQLAFLRQEADTIIDTSKLLITELKTQIKKIYVKNEKNDSLVITITSFGYKHGIPEDSDLVFDARFLPNPDYVLELKDKTGNDTDVSGFILSFDKCKEFLERLIDMLGFLVPNYISEGKNQLTISVGCNVGKHRSVALVNELSKRLESPRYGIKTEHRDIYKGG